MKYIFICGGPISGIGKGTIISSLGVLLKSCGWNVTAIKIDPYLNVDAGTMSPFEHGEVYVLHDGAEVDLDLGNYERFLGIQLTRHHSITTGKIYLKVISSERKGDYLGKTSWIKNTAREAVDPSLPLESPEICLVEVGGTVGDIESGCYYETIRQMIITEGRENCCIVFVSYIPVMHDGEQKTKPTQHGVKDLRLVGLAPDFICCRSPLQLTHSARQKIALFTSVKEANVIGVPNLRNLYDVPLCLLEQNLPQYVAKRLKLEIRVAKMCGWSRLTEHLEKLNSEGEEVRIAIVGKYTGLQDSYLSVIKGLIHAAYYADRKLKIVWVESSTLLPTPKEGCVEEESKVEIANQHPESESELILKGWKELEEADGILIPGGFGERGVEGKILVAKYARENNKPFLGICLGFQIAIIEICRNVLGLRGANSTEIEPETEHPVIIDMPDHTQTIKGGTMRLGAKTTHIKEGSLAHALYGGAQQVEERHRHRYEVNTRYLHLFHQNSFLFSGKDNKGERMEIFEIPLHPYFFATQFHPEFITRPFAPSPPFIGLILAASHQLTKSLEVGGGKIVLDKNKFQVISIIKD